MKSMTGSREGPKSQNFTVLDGLPQDKGKGYVRVPRFWLEKLGIELSDSIMIRGKKDTVVIVLPTKDEDGNDPIIRMGNLVRKNAEVALNEFVTILKIETRYAEKVGISLLNQDLRISWKPEKVAQELEGRVVTKGDVLTVRVGTQRNFKAPKEIAFVAEFFEQARPVNVEEVRIIITATTPISPGIEITKDTEIQYMTLPETLKGIPKITYEDIGGMSDPIQRIREMIELPLSHPELFEQLGIDPPNGVLLWGPPGTGKTLLAQAVANECSAYFISINGPEIMGKFYGESEERIREVFMEAQENAPAILFIDELDAIAPKREEVTGEVERRVVSQFLSAMDGMRGRGRVVVIAATNRPNAIDPALRRPGRFDREIEVGIPDEQGRNEILAIHNRGVPLKDDVDLDHFSRITHGFVGADLAALCREAAMQTLRRYLPEIDLEKSVVPPEILSKMQVTQSDYLAALRIVQPSALREVSLQIPDVHWEDIGGLDSVKQKMKELIEWPLKYPESFESQGIRRPRGILLYGAPGAGKTLLAKAIASEIEANFISLKGPEILSKYVGDSEKAIREIFRKARQAAPSILFLDEIDAIAPVRGTRQGSGVTETVVNQILTELDGIEELRGVMVIGASNRPDILDPAMLRAGRFDRHIHVPAPDEVTRRKIFEVHTREMRHDNTINLDDLAKMTEGYVGADIENVCTEAVIEAMRRDVKKPIITKNDFLHALEVIPYTVTDEVVQSYKAMEEKLRKRKILKGANLRSDFV